MSEARLLLQKLVRQASQESPHHVISIADRILDEHPELVAQFFQEERVVLFHTWVSDLLRVTRQRRSFSQHRDLSDISVYDLSFVIDPENNRKPLGEMMRADHFYVADEYDRQVEQLRGLSQVHRRLGRGVGIRKTREVYDEQTLAKLLGV